MGTGTLPGGIPDGLDLQLLVGSESFSVGVLPENLFAPTNTCGSTIEYTVHRVSAGTYTLEFEILDPNSDEFETLYEGRATQSFTIQEGETLRFDAVFQ